MPLFMPSPKQKKPVFIPPEGGWKPHTAYLVEVSWRAENPIHRALLHVGFVEDDQTFGNYCEVWQNSYDAAILARHAFYLKAITELTTLE